MIMNTNKTSHMMIIAVLFALLLSSCSTYPITHTPFSVTSGRTTIFPLGHFSQYLSFDEESGSWTSACGFPYLGEWIDELETIYFEPNFRTQISNNTSYSYLILTNGIRSEQFNDINSLPPGEYIIQYVVRYRHRYIVSEAKYTESSYVYWFRLIV